MPEDFNQELKKQEATLPSKSDSIKPVELSFNEDTIGQSERTESRLDSIWGDFSHVTTTPTWVPKTLDQSIALDTTTGGIYYYDRQNNTWRSVGDISTKIFELKVFDDTTAVSTGDGKLIFCIPQAFNGLNLTSAHAFCSTYSSSGTPTVMIRNVTDSQDMLSTAITIDTSEYTSYTAATAPVINASYDDVATGDLIAIDVDVAGTGTKGLGVILTFG